MTKATSTYSVSEIMAHMEVTGMDFHAAHADLQATRGQADATLYPCAQCGERIVRAPDTLCGACLFPDD